MEGVLQKFDTDRPGIFTAGQWKEYYFILHEEVLMFMEVSNRTQIVGKLHMAVSKLLPDAPNQGECEIRINSGLIDVWLKGNTIKDKIDWKNAFNDSQKQTTGKRYTRLR